MINAVIITRLGLIIFSLFASFYFPKNYNGAQITFQNSLQFYWQSLAQWDGGNFIRIANYGYQELQDYAFFPLYPLIIKFLNIIFENSVFSGIIISNLSFLLFLFLLYKYVKIKFSDNVAKNTVLTYLFFPTAFYASLIYSESLFLQLENRIY